MSHDSGKLNSVPGGVGPSFTIGGSGVTGSFFNELTASAKYTVNILGVYPVGSSISLKNAAGSVILGPFSSPQAITNVTLAAGTYFFQLNGAATDASGQIRVTG